MAIRFMPMPAPHPIWSDDGGFPEKLKVSFRNGKVRTYRLDFEVTQPRPHLFSAAELDRLYCENGYRPKHLKK